MHYEIEPEISKFCTRIFLGQRVSPVSSTNSPEKNKLHLTYF